MKKATILTLITLCILSFASCGKQETTSGNESITARVFELFFLNIPGFSGFLLLSYPVCGP